MTGDQTHENHTEDTNIEYTISQDRGDGNSAHAEVDYALLASNQSKPAGNLPSYFSVSAYGGNRQALKDYQAQLMALEQVNRAKLRALRIDAGYDPDAEPVLKKLPRRESMATLQDSKGFSRRDQIEENRPQMQGRSENQSETESEEDSEVASMELGSDDHEEDASGRQTNTLTFLDKAKLNNKGEYCVLYRVGCADRDDRCHRRIYVDEPRRVLVKANGTYHLRGTELIPDLDDFLRELPKIGFIVYRDYFCEKGTRSSLLGSSSAPGSKFFRETISVVSEELQNILQRNSMFAPDFEAYKIDSYDRLRARYESSPGLSSSPSEYTSRFLYQHRDQLNRCAATAVDGSPVKALISYINSRPDKLYRICDEMFSRGMVTHGILAWLFRPNEMLVSTKGPAPTAYVLRRVPLEGSTLRLECWNWGYDGHQLRRKDSTLTVDIDRYGETRIDQLSVYPIRFAPRATRDVLQANGDKFWTYRTQTLVSYEGPDFQNERIYPYDSRFMVDYQVYSKFHASANAFHLSDKDIAAFDRWPKSLHVSRYKSLSEQDLILLPPGIHGFYLKEKKWMHLLVENIQPVNWNKAAFEQLVLPKRTKNIIKALVMIRKQTKDGSTPQIGLRGNNDDIIAGKGSGLIMLLHGGPGTGKTLTAESVAELAEMPLYSVTCGDIGTSPEAVEKYLTSVLHLGKKWNCVLLLDEADVFLEERTLSDLERNSLVSVFLRTLEYYDGVLILTSNRVGTFDEAFKSRIQLALHYPPLDAPGRRKIWHNFLNMLSKNDEKVDVDDIKAHMDELSGYELNGRQIRNALTTARQLALFEQDTLDWDRVKDSIEVAGDFNRYIKEIHGHTDEEWSRENNLR